MVINSPSSINIYHKCPRLYYYQYIERRPSFPHIDLIKGSIVHKSLQEFFGKIPSLLETDFKSWASLRVKQAFMQSWQSKINDIGRLNLSEQAIKESYQDCIEMLNHWLDDFILRIDESKLPFREAFARFKPSTEEEFFCEEYQVRGFLDAIENIDGKADIIDYKTSSKIEITKENKLQLAVYAYLYYKKYGKFPDKVGIYFLREKIHFIAVDKSMVEFGERECKIIYEKTKSVDINDYPKNTGYLCKMLGGKCPCYQYELEEEPVLGKIKK